MVLNKIRNVQKAAAVLAALLVWQAAAVILDQKILLASPVEVIMRLSALIFEAEFWYAIGFSFWRIILGFAMALIAGVTLASMAGKWSFVETLLWPYVSVVKTIPVASFVIMSLIWLSAKQLSIFISFLIVFPVIYSNVLTGIKSTDRQILEMAKVFHIPLYRRVLYIYLPQLKPFLLSACSTALGLCWKSGIAAEVIGIPDGSVGEMLYQAKIYLDTADLFAWTLVIILMSVCFEKLFLLILRWGFSLIERK